ncbi:hemerythrin domain-containing protein [Naasia aerilata]|uniref:Hemerythrin-like domain-containing protein n=1 Tax=Naasia aerilata TaxID=1162966 RepID=A0ABN6XRF8_9MICO|nr:hemerythrin domain-containing protein [Naasia aerilata]BDZ47439.1 hypothetical protein GCM10025866_33480 [Naasia aerilata]
MAPERKGKTDRVGCDTSDMVMVHNFLRHVYSPAPELVAGIRDGDSARASVVAGHLGFLIRFLHNHHRSEDIVLWDELERRTPACALHVGLMRRQHQEVGDLLDDLEPRIAAWGSTASAADGAAIVAGLERLNRLLFTHLGQEESQILPTVSATWTQKEWQQLEAHARKGVTPKEIMVLLGFILESMTPEARASFLREAGPVGLIYRVFGERRFSAYRRRLYGVAA